MSNGNRPINPSRNLYKYDDRPDVIEVYTGLTKREHFAGLAMQSFIVKYGNDHQSESDLAVYAVLAADALLKELDK